MTFLPIVTRELRVTARKRSVYWVRFALTAIALALMGWSLLTLQVFGGSPFAGKFLFATLTGLAWLYAFIGGALTTADTLSGEKRDGTLGLLFLTDLKGYDVVLGKIVAASVNWLFGLLALFPVLAIVLLMGGVAPGEFWRKILALTNLLFFSLALGMFVSAISRSERRAAAATIVILLITVMGMSEIADWRKEVTGANELSPWLVYPDVARPFEYAQDGFYQRNSDFYWGSLAGSHAIAWMLLLLASVIVPRTWQQSAGVLARWEERTQQASYGRNTERRRGFRVRALRVNPFYWVASRSRQRTLGLYFAIIVLFLYHAVDTFSMNRMPGPLAPQKLHAAEYLWYAITFWGVLKLWFAFEACRRFVEDRRSGALELILSTPLTVSAIIRGQWLALARQFGGPVFVVLLITLAPVALGTWIGLPVSGLSWGGLLAMAVAGTVIFLADLFALGWVSMWRGMKARHSYTALLWSVVQLLVAPWIVFYVALTGFFMLVAIGRGANAPTNTRWWIDHMPEIMATIWFVVSLVTALVSGFLARRSLKTNFRYNATFAYQPAKAGPALQAKPPTQIPPAIPAPPLLP